MKTTYSAFVSLLLAAGWEGTFATTTQSNQTLDDGFATHALEVPLYDMSDDEFFARMAIDPLLDDIPDHYYDDWDNNNTTDNTKKVSNLRGKQVDTTMTFLFEDGDGFPHNETNNISEEESLSKRKNDDSTNGRALTVCGADGRDRVTSTTSSPWSAVVNLRVTFQNGETGGCTGFFIGPRVVGTASHCLYSRSHGGYARSIQVIPGRNGSSRPYGSQFAVRIFSNTRYTQTEGANYDYGAVILPDTTLSRRVGYFGYGVRSDSQFRSSTLNTAGYPGDKGGSTQWYDNGRVSQLNSRRVTYLMDTFRGQSGSPVWVRNSNGNRIIVAMHTQGGCPNRAVRVNQAVYNFFRHLRNNFS